VVDAEDYEANAQLYASATATAASALANYTTNQLMMMGV
jgi:hypothetical protein